MGGPRFDPANPSSHEAWEQTVNILHLEGDEGDSERVQAKLAESGMKCRLHTVKDREAFLTALQVRRFDVVLSDSTVPNFPGLAALQLVRESDSTLPFIFVSGTIGEEAAIEAMRSGATDYVFKHRLDKLPLVIRRARSEAEQRNQRIQAELTLRSADQKFRSLAQSAPDAIIFTDDSGRVVLWNMGAQSIFGWTEQEVIGRSVTQLVPDDELKRHQETIMGESASSRLGTLCQAVETAGVRKGGEKFPAEVSVSSWEMGEGRYYIAILRDITVRKRSEEAHREQGEMLRQAQKMEAVGNLAGGVAHDFNNLLSVILGYAEMLEDDVTLAPEHHDLLRLVTAAGHRAADLTRQLLAFSRRQVLLPRRIDLNVCVHSVAKMLNRVIGEHVTVKTVLADDLWAVQADPGQMEQVLMNLSVNARDAMPRGGTLFITTRNVPAGGSDPQRVRIEVRDTGMGMDTATLSQVFDPFFTTKGSEQGTGLGLSMVQGIIIQSGGTVSVTSEPGVGSEFQVSLPRAPHEEAGVAEVTPVTRVLNRTLRILLVEDQEEVRRLARIYLVRAGHEVIEASGGSAALALAATTPGLIDLLITDVVMPGQSGADLAEALKEKIPTLRVLFMSGYTDDTLQRLGVLWTEVALLEKPFSGASLMAKVREVMELDGSVA